MNFIKSRHDQIAVLIVLICIALYLRVSGLKDNWPPLLFLFVWLSLFIISIFISNIEFNANHLKGKPSLSRIFAYRKNYHSRFDVIPLTDKTMTIRLADGTHDLSIEIEFRVDDQLTLKEFDEQRDSILNISKEHLEGYRYKDLIPSHDQPEEAAEAGVETEAEKLNSIVDREIEERRALESRKHHIAEELMKSLNMHGIIFVKEIHLKNLNIIDILENGIN